MCIIGRYGRLILIVDLCVCVYAICFMRDGCERMCESIKYVPSFVRTHMWMSVCDFQACVFVC